MIDFRKYTNSPVEHFNAVSFRDDHLLRQRYESNFTEGTFQAVCLSSFGSEENTGATSGSSDVNSDGVFVEIVVKPISQQEYLDVISGDFIRTDSTLPIMGDSLPPLVGLTDPMEINTTLQLYYGIQSLRAKCENKNSINVQFGEIVECYYEFGSIIEGTAQKLRFRKIPTLEDIHPKYKELLGFAPFLSAQKAFSWGSPSLLGQFRQSSSNKTSAPQARFIEKLRSALKAKGLKFHVTDRSRTVEDQMQRILNKYNGNGPNEVIATYGNRGRRMVQAIQKGDMAQLKKEAANSSKHLKGNAIDIRSRWYTDEQMLIVLSEIRKLGGNPLVEPVSGGCWQKSGRNVTNAKRLASPGGLKGAKCYNEHIHIDIPEGF